MTDRREHRHHPGVVVGVVNPAMPLVIERLSSDSVRDGRGRLWLGQALTQHSRRHRNETVRPQALNVLEQCHSRRSAFAVLAFP
jgi:hypothetical protein